MTTNIDQSDLISLVIWFFFLCFERLYLCVSWAFLFNLAKTRVLGLSVSEDFVILACVILIQ